MIVINYHTPQTLQAFQTLKKETAISDGLFQK